MFEGAHDLRNGDQAAGENGCCTEAVHASGGKYRNYLELIMDGAANWVYTNVQISHPQMILKTLSSL